MAQLALCRLLLFILSIRLVCGDRFHKQALDEHNRLRAKHGVPNLVLDTTLMRFSQSWANYLARNNIFEHSTGPYGENLWMITGGDVDGATPVRSWYDEINDYNFRQPGFSMKTGHFTQVVWKNSKRLGIGYAKSANGATFVVANYDPPGNYGGQYRTNVFPPKN